MADYVPSKTKITDDYVPQKMQGDIASQKAFDITDTKYTMEEQKILNVIAKVSYGGIPEKYKLLEDSYRGSGGYEDGSYIIAHPREAYEKYVRRQGLAYYPNYVKPVVDAYVSPIFKTSPVRTGKGEIPLNAFYEKFLLNVDGKNTSMNEFMQNVAIKAKLDGVRFLIMDMPVKNKPIMNKKDLFSNLPYLYAIGPENVEEWAFDKFGNLILFSFKLKVSNIDEETNEVIENTEIWKWTTNKVIVETSNDGMTNKEKKAKRKRNKNIVEEFENTIGMIPVIPVYGTENDTDELIPQSDIYPIARTNYAIYNACSELRERNRNQAFSILTYPVADDENYSDVSELAISTADMLMYREGSQSPDFITPEASSSQMLVNELNFMVNELYRMAKLQAVTGVQTQASGLAKEWDNVQLFQTIDDFSRRLELCEYKIAEIFGRYIKEAIEISINYNNKFGVVDVTQTINITTQALALNISPEFNLEVKKQCIRDTLRNEEDDVINRVINDLVSNSSARDPIDTDPKVLSYANKG